MKDVAIRPATPDDAPALRELGRRVTWSTYAPISEAYATWTLETWWDVAGMRESMASTPHWVAVDEDGEIVGVANLGELDGVPVMWKLYLDERAQGQGIGSALLATVVEAARQRGADELRLEYMAGNDRAAAFYRAHGFVETGVTVHERFPDQVWMVLGLRG